MSLTGERIFVGFGLGAIQTGLFLYEAQASGNFGRLVVAEVIPETLRQVRENNGYLTVNIAHPDHIETAQVGPIEVFNPAIDSDRQSLVEALSTAHEITTAVPGVAFYGNPLEAASLSRILADGLLAHITQGGPRAVIYAAENHNHAAEILCQQVFANIPIAEQRAILSQVRFLNTVIGKMSGVVVDPAEITALGLTPMTPNGERAFLVEVFNRILISRIDFSAPHFQRGITTFVEKDNLLPFEEAKLYGHNATHALGAYLGALLNVRRIADLAETPGMLNFLRRAFIEESGAALIHRYAGLDPLFTPEGYAAYADDLLMRMCNPNLSDTTDRVGRDVERKLGWDDRLIGTLRLVMSEGVPPTRYILGATAALVYLDSTYLNNTLDPAETLYPLWGNRESLPEQEAVLDLIRAGLDRLRRWYAKSPGDSLALLENL